MAMKRMIHHGKATATIPAVRREVLDTDPASETFGRNIIVEDSPEKQITMQLSAGAAFGQYAVGRVYEVDAATAKHLAGRGFEEASETEATKAAKAAEVKAGGDIAQAERERAATQAGGDFVESDEAPAKSTRKGARD